MSEVTFNFDTTTAAADKLKTTFISVDEVTDGTGTNVYGFQTWLYADTAFDTWKAAISNPDETQNDIINNYSNYALRIRCDITNIDGTDENAATRVWNGCCIQDKSQKGGGYCHTIQTENAVRASITFNT